MTPRIAPVDLETTTDPLVREMFAKALIGANGKPINIFGTLAHHPKLADRFNRFGGMLLRKGLVPGREREIVILRIGWNCQSVYEFGQHTLIGAEEGLTTEEIRALTLSPEAHAWTDDDRALIALADDLCRDNEAREATWAALSGRWNDAELIELVLVAGFYRMVSGFLKTMRVELDEGVPSWPETD